MRVAILDDYQGVALAAADWGALSGRAEVCVIREPLTDERQVIERLGDFDVVVLNRERTALSRERISLLPRLSLIVTFGMRNASVDISAAAERGITVCGTQTLGHGTVELTWALILAVFRQIPGEAAAIASGRWQSTVGKGLKGRTLGVAGLGRIGKEVARIGQAFGMPVLAWSRSLTGAQASEMGVTSVDFPTLLRDSDVLTLHLGLNPQTRAIIGPAELAAMKSSALLVNTARGELIDEIALAASLRSGQIAAAAIDTFALEPVPPDHPLVGLSNAILTPHLGYVIEENYRTTFGQALEDIVAWLDGEPMRVIAGGTPGPKQ